MRAKKKLEAFVKIRSSLILLVLRSICGKREKWRGKERKKEGEGGKEIEREEKILFI